MHGIHLALESDGGGIRPKSMKAGDKFEESKGAKVTSDTPEEYIQQHVVKLKQQIDDLRSALSSELAIYRNNSEKAVKYETAKVIVHKLRSHKLVREHIHT